MDVTNSTTSSTTKVSLIPCPFHSDCGDDSDVHHRNYVFKIAVWAAMALCAAGIIVNCLSLYILFLSFALKHGSLFLEILGVSDIMTCTMVIPLEIYAILKIDSVQVQRGACVMLSALDAWLCFVTLLSVLAASIYILVHSVYLHLPNPKRKSWSGSIGLIVLLSLLLAVLMWAARPVGIQFYEKSDNPAKSSVQRSSCTFREAQLLESTGLAATIMVGIRLGLLALITVTMGAASIAFVVRWKRQEESSQKSEPCLANQAGRPKWWGQPVNYGRLVDAVDFVVDEGVEHKGGLADSTSMVQWVADTLTADKKLIDAVIDCYFHGDLGDSGFQRKQSCASDESKSSFRPNTAGNTSRVSLTANSHNPYTDQPSRPHFSGDKEGQIRQTFGGSHQRELHTSVLSQPKPPFAGKSPGAEGQIGQTSGGSHQRALHTRVLNQPKPLLAGKSPGALSSEARTSVASDDQFKNSTGGPSHEGTSPCKFLSNETNLPRPVHQSETSLRSSQMETRKRFITFQQTKDPDDHASDRPVRPSLDPADHASDGPVRPNPNMEQDSVDYHYFRAVSSIDMHVHSALTYLHVTDERQLAVRKEMIYQRALNRLERSGLSVESKMTPTMNLLRPAARYISVYFCLCICLPVCQSLTPPAYALHIVERPTPSV